MIYVLSFSEVWACSQGHASHVSRIDVRAKMGDYQLSLSIALSSSQVVAYIVLGNQVWRHCAQAHAEVRWGADAGETMLCFCGTARPRNNVFDASWVDPGTSTERAPPSKHRIYFVLFKRVRTVFRVREHIYNGVLGGNSPGKCGSTLDVVRFGASWGHHYTFFYSFSVVFSTQEGGGGSQPSKSGASEVFYHHDPPPPPPPPTSIRTWFYDINNT